MKTKLLLQRVNHQWWAVVDNDVRFVTGYSCAPSNPDMWWCPEVGLSLSEKYHLFTSEVAALDSAILEVIDTIARFRQSLEELEKRRKTLGQKE